MIRTQIYITAQEKKALLKMTQHTGQSQSELIRQAIDLLCQFTQTHSADRLNLLKSAKGIWGNRNKADFVAIRKSMDRL